MKHFNEYCDTVLGPDPDRAQWLHARKSGIGSSDASAIVGANQYASPLSVWIDKTSSGTAGDSGQVVDRYPSLAARHGSYTEPLVADLFTEQTGLTVSKVGLLRSRTWPWMIASCDRLVDGEPALLECKTTEARNFSEWSNDEVPDHALIQVVHQMAVTGLQRAYVAVLIGNSDFQVRVVERNEAAIVGLVDRISTFWHTNIIGGAEPEVSQASDLDLIKTMRAPQHDHSVVATPALEQLLSRRAQLGKQMSVLKQDHDVVSGQIIQLLQGAGAVTSINGDVICTYSEVKREGYTVGPATFRQLRITTRGKEYING